MSAAPPRKNGTEKAKNGTKKPELNLFTGAGLGPLPPNVRTIGELVYWADTVPPHRVIEGICYYSRRLADVGIEMRAQQARYMIVIAVLATRGPFEVLGLPKDPAVDPASCL